MFRFCFFCKCSGFIFFSRVKIVFRYFILIFFSIQCVPLLLLCCMLCLFILHGKVVLRNFVFCSVICGVWFQHVFAEVLCYSVCLVFVHAFFGSKCCHMTPPPHDVPAPSFSLRCSCSTRTARCFQQDQKSLWTMKFFLFNMFFFNSCSSNLERTSANQMSVGWF